MPLSQANVGVQNQADGAQSIVLRAGRQGEQLVSELHGRYYEQAYRQNIFQGAGLAQTTSAGTTTTYVGLCLTNPIGSGVNLVINKIGYAFTVAFAAASTIGLMRGYSATTAVTQTTAVTPVNSLTAANSGKALLATSATLPVTPTVTHILDAGLTGAITTTPTSAPGNLDMEGSVVIPPGGFIAFYTSSASGTSGANYSFSWEEVPV